MILERIVMADAGPSLSHHSLLSEPDCFGRKVTTFSEGSAAMDMCVKTEPDDEDISHLADCTEVHCFSAEEMDSELHLDHIKTEIVMVNIKEDSADQQLHSNTEVLCPASQQLNCSTGLLSKQCKSKIGEVKVGQHSQVQELSCTEKEMNEANYCNMKEEYRDIQVNELSTFPCSLFKQCKLETNELKVEHHSQLQETLFTETNINEGEHYGLKEEDGEFQVHELKSIHCPSFKPCKLETNGVKVEPTFQSGGSSARVMAVNEAVSGPLQKSVIKQNSLVIAGDDSQTNYLSKGSCYDVVIHKVPKWQCLHCKKVFKRQSYLTKHLQSHSADKYCYLQHGKSLPQVCHSKEDQHILCGEKPYKCSECGKGFSRGDNLKQHLRVHSGEKPYTCSDCGKKFFRKSTFKLHQRIHSGEKPYKCYDCGKSFSVKGRLNRHKIVHSGEKPYKCRECGKGFISPGVFKSHLCVHSGEKPYKCSQCEKSFSRPDYLKQHQRVHSGVKPYICSVCGRSFSRTDHLKEHQRIHSGEKPYKCIECGKSFSFPSFLKQHQRVHSDDKPYVCTPCGKSFSRPDYLKQHERVHSGEKPFKCNECGKSYSQAGNLKQHQRVHTGEKPYKCSHCEKSFSQAALLRQHQRIHTGEKPYKCSQCEKSFSQPGHLKKHQQVHSDDKSLM